MVNPKNCFGEVRTGAFVCAAGAIVVTIRSAAASAAARMRRTYMYPPPGGGYSIRSVRLDRDADRRTPRLGHHAAGERRTVLVDRPVRVAAVEVGVAVGIERIRGDG